MDQHLPEGVRRRLYRRVPDAAWVPAMRAVGFWNMPLDAGVLARIATEPPDRLSDPDFLTHELLPDMGFTFRCVVDGVFPAQLHHRVGRGVQSIQFPIQFGPYLAAMTQQKVSSYLELGVERGGTFAVTVEVLRRFGLRRALAVDLDRPAILEQWSRPEVSFGQVNSRSSAFADLVRQHAPIDLALIDGDHSEEGVRNDFEVLRPHTRMLAFHDIAEAGWPDVGQVWKSIKRDHANEYEFLEFVEQYPETPDGQLGIGVAIRRDEKPAE